jgi:hypothetical protein
VSWKGLSSREDTLLEFMSEAIGAWRLSERKSSALFGYLAVEAWAMPVLNRRDVLLDDHVKATLLPASEQWRV